MDDKGDIEMNGETKQLIANLVSSAPAAAVIAAWAGEEVELSASLGWIYYDDRPWESNRQPVLVPYQRGRANSEQTLRRWMLNGECGWEEDKTHKGYRFTLFFTLDGVSVTEVAETADSPETAFRAAMNKFANALREEAAA